MIGLRAAIATLIAMSAAAPALGQFPHFGIIAGNPNGAAALRDSLDEAWSVVSPTPPTKAEAPEVERDSLSVSPPAEKTAKPATPRTIRRKTANTAESPGQSRDATAAGATTGGSWMRTLASLAGVVAMILFLAWGAKSMRNVGVGGARPRRTGLIEVISRTALSQKQSVCLVRVGPRMVLIGVTPDRLQALDVITDADTVAKLAGDAMSAERVRESGTFIQRLEKEGSHYLDGETPVAGASAASADSATVLRDRLKNSVARLRLAAAKK